MNTFVVVRVRAAIGLSDNEHFALKVMHLDRPNACVLMTDTPEHLGMIKHMEGVLTWGVASEETMASLRKHVKDPKAMAFKLSPPLKGYSRKGNKMAFKNGGALGDRGDKINDLIKRMVR